MVRGLTGGPAILQASDWVLKKFNEWGLANAHRETWPFGKGWSLVRFSAHMIEPQVQPLIGFPGSWTPGTRGTITADVVRVQIDYDADFEKYRGKLAGQDRTDAARTAGADARRAYCPSNGREGFRRGRDDACSARARRGEATRSADGHAAAGRGRGAAVGVCDKDDQFLKAEGVVAVFNRGSDTIMASVGSDLSAEQQHTDGGTIFPTGNGSRGADAGSGLPTVTLAVEHYNRMVRVLGEGHSGEGRTERRNEVLR